MSERERVAEIVREIAGDAIFSSNSRTRPEPDWNAYTDRILAALRGDASERFKEALDGFDVSEGAKASALRILDALSVQPVRIAPGDDSVFIWLDTRYPIECFPDGADACVDNRLAPHQSPGGKRWLTSGKWF